MRIVTLEAEFPELVSGKMYQTARAQAGNIPAAVRRGLTEILGRDGVRKHRITVVKLRLSISNGQG